MNIPTIQGLIDRRILVNFIADPFVAAKYVPSPFRIKLYQGAAIVGVCLIRLKHIRPKGFPKFLGVSSENAAYRFAVEWDENGETKEGVYIPKRDTSLYLNSLVGGRLFPGKHYFSKFNVKEFDERYHLDYISSDKTKICLDAIETDAFDSNSIFKTLENVSSFFEKGAVGYSPNKNRFEGLQLKTYKWEIKPLKVERIESNFFEDEKKFPKGSIKFDNALLMKQIEHEWKGVGYK